MDCRHEHEAHGGGGDDGHNHNHSHGHGHSHSHEPEDPDGHSLFSFIDTTQVRCLNESSPGMALNPLKPYDKRTERDPYLESQDDDPELILFVPFTQAVKMKSFCVVGGGGGSAPEHVKLWINRDDIDFNNAEDLPALQELDLVESNPAADIDYPLVQRKFQNVSSITMFFSGNYGADASLISYIGFKGENTNKIADSATQTLKYLPLYILSFAMELWKQCTSPDQCQKTIRTLRMNTKRMTYYSWSGWQKISAEIDVEKVVYKHNIGPGFEKDQTTDNTEHIIFSEDQGVEDIVKGRGQGGGDVSWGTAVLQAFFYCSNQE